MNLDSIVFNLRLSFNKLMEIKGFESKTSTIETPNDSGNIEKPLQNHKVQRVDINVLKSKLREKENRILKKNIIILATFLTITIMAGIFVTYI